MNRPTRWAFRLWLVTVAMLIANSGYTALGGFVLGLATMYLIFFATYLQILKQREVNT